MLYRRGLSWPCDGGAGRSNRASTAPLLAQYAAHGSRAGPRRRYAPGASRPDPCPAGRTESPTGGRPNHGIRGRGRRCSASPRPRARPCVRVRASSPRGLGRPRGEGLPPRACSRRAPLSLRPWCSRSVESAPDVGPQGGDLALASAQPFPAAPSRVPRAASPNSEPQDEV